MSSSICFNKFDKAVCENHEKPKVLKKSLRCESFGQHTDVSPTWLDKALPAQRNFIALTIRQFFLLETTFRKDFVQHLQTLVKNEKENDDIDDDFWLIIAC